MRLLSDSNNASKIRIVLGVLTAALVVAGALLAASAQSGGGDPVLIGAGDIASCNSTGDEATAKLLDSIPGTIFLAGDDAYDSGTAQQFADCYDPCGGASKTGRARRLAITSISPIKRRPTSAISALPPATQLRAITATISASGTLW